jgi:1-acyl-sn-glycerol-3-phosphate acyltransferase
MGDNRYSRALRVITEAHRYIKAGQPDSSDTAEKQEWAKSMLKLLNVKLTVLGEPTAERPAIFVGNHISYLDIVLLLACIPDVSFVAKQELANWPIFGKGAKKFQTIFVKRANAYARSSALATIRTALEEERKGVALFPSGTTCLDESKPWKFGAFRLAQSVGAPLQVFRLRYEPLRTVAYIDNDFFLTHLLRLCALDSISATLEFAPAGKIENPQKDCAHWQAWAAAR